MDVLRPRDGRRRAEGLPRNDDSPFFHQAPKKINHHLSCPFGFMCLLLDRSLGKGEGGVPFRSSATAHVPSFARSVANDPSPYSTGGSSVSSRQVLTELGEPENNYLSALIQHPTLGSQRHTAGEDDVGRSGWSSPYRCGLPVTGRSPPEMRFFTGRCWRLVGRRQEMAGR